MNLRDEIIEERKKHLGLNKTDTEEIYDKIINYYKKIMIQAPRNIIDYVIDITICNMNNYNKLGNIEDINRNWGDSNIFVDLKNSVFLAQEVDEESYIESCDERICFSDISDFTDIEDISFSIKELIESCEKDDISIRIFTKDNSENPSAIEIEPHKRFEMTEDIKRYLDSLK